MINQATRSGEKQRFVIANGLVREKGWASPDSAGLTWVVDTVALSVNFCEAQTAIVLDERYQLIVGTRAVQALVSPGQPRLDLAQYSGEWVVISNDRAGEHGADLADVVRRARQRGDSKPYVVFVEQLAEGAARIGI